MTDDKSVTVDGKLWGVPWVWGVTSYAYDHDTIKEPLTSIEALWDPKHAGRIAFRDDGLLAVELAAIALGQDINNPTDLPAIKTKLLR